MKNIIVCTLLAIVTPFLASAITCETRNQYAYIKYEVGGEGIECIHVFKYSDIDTIQVYSEKGESGTVFHTVTIRLKLIAGTGNQREINIHKISENERDILIDHLLGSSANEG